MRPEEAGEEERRHRDPAARRARARRSHAAQSKSAVTSMYEVASGERNVETRRRSGCSLPVL